MSSMSAVGITYHPLLPRARELADALADRYSDGASWWSSPVDQVGDRAGELDATDLVVTIGGDGTILRAAHDTAPRAIPVLAINMGRVGFMSEIEAEDALEQLGWYMDGKARVEERLMLHSEIVGAGNKPFHALNDVVVGRGGEVRIVDLRAVVSGAYLETYRADALVIATATGSTGYSLALGGPVMDPQSDSILLKPVAAHMSLHGGLILPSDAVVEITLESAAEAVLSADGFLHVPLQKGQTVRAQVSQHRARFLRRHPATAFYESLTRRLGMRQESMARRGTGATASQLDGV